MKNWLSALCISLLFLGCEKKSTLTETDGLQFCPINWVNTGPYVVKPSWAVVSYSIIDFENQQMVWEIVLPEHEEAAIFHLDGPLDSGYYIPIDRFYKAKYFEYSTVFEKTDFPENMTFCLSAVKKLPYYLPFFGRRDSVCEVSISRKSTGFEIFGRANKDSVLIGNGILDFKKAEVSLRRFPDHWQFSCALFDGSGSATPFFQATKTLQETIIEDMVLGVRGFYDSPTNTGEMSKMRLLFEKMQVKTDDGHEILDEFECNSVLNF